MSDGAIRPDPDELLRRVQQEEARARRAKLRIFFGFAPGVGKTYRMLQVARELAERQGFDVVVGLVETHTRPETAALLEGLPILPRRAVEYRGRTLHELDLDAALARRPQLLLVDELAHTNAPGSRHAKRWQDVLELLDAGIDVMSTVNVQHVESLNDVVAQITQVQVRETIPDSMLDRADEIELVDLAPEVLLARLREGKVYLPDQAARAAEHFFKRGNLLALRELALRRTAQRVDEDVREYRVEHGVEQTWPAGERVLVCVGPSPSSSRLVRAGARIAAGLRAPWVALYVEPMAPGGLDPPARERLEAHLQLAQSLGASVTRTSHTDIGEAVLGYARKHNVTRILVGRPTHSRLWDRLRGSLLDDIVRGSGGIDVLVCSGDAPPESPPVTRPAAPQGGWHPPRPAPYVKAAAAVAFTTAVALAVRALLPVPDLEVLFVLAVMVVAVRVGRWPSILAAALAVASYDFFFVPPYYTFAVAEGRYFLTFALMFGVGLLVSELTARIRRQEQDALLREERTAALYALSRQLNTATSAEEAALILARRTGEVTGAPAHVLATDAQQELRVLAAVPAGRSLRPKDLAVADWALEHGRAAGIGTDTLPGARALCLPLWVRGEPLAVLALEPGPGTRLGLEQRELLEAMGRVGAAVLEQCRLREEARSAALRAQTEEMRSSLLSTVSHDLRTPLAVITGAASSLREAGLGGERTKDLVETVCEEAERLERLVGDLLDMTRFEAGGVTLRREWVPLEELVGAALQRLEARLAGREVRVDLAPDLPLVSLDAVLFEQLLVNLLENAAKYTPSGAGLEIRAAVEGGDLALMVRDHGPGLPANQEERIFEKFYRGAHVGIPGAGLGLPICRAIVLAHGGRIWAENHPEGGAVFRLTIPRGSPPADLSPAPVTA